MNRLRFQEPSAGCLIPGILGGGVTVFGVVIAIGLSQTPAIGGMRLIAPMYAVAGYWMLTLCNRRTVVVDATGVRVTFGPVPAVRGYFVPRKEIAFCYARDTVANYEEGAVPDGTYFAIGVETRAGQRLHFYSRDAGKETALAAAREISQIFNANPAEPRIEARLVTAGYVEATVKREFVFWGVLALAAIALGAFWELRQ